MQDNFSEGPMLIESLPVYYRCTLAAASYVSGQVVLSCADSCAPACPLADLQAGFIVIPPQSSQCIAACRQRSQLYYPGYAWVLPATLLRIPYSLLISIVATAVLYWVMGFDTNPGRSVLMHACTAFLT